MPKHQCPFPACKFTTKDVSDDLAAVLIKVHADGSHNVAKSKSAKVENVRRPVISTGGTIEDWQYFQTRWNDYKEATNISGRDKIIQLLECCDSDLRKALSRAAGGSLTGSTEEVVLKKNHYCHWTP